MCERNKKGVPTLTIRTFRISGPARYVMITSEPAKPSIPDLLPDCVTSTAASHPDLAPQSARVTSIFFRGPLRRRRCPTRLRSSYRALRNLASIRSGTQRGQGTRTPGRRCVPKDVARFDTIPGAASPAVFTPEVREPKFLTPRFFDPGGFSSLTFWSLTS
jgi:hypothetical protein